MRRVVERDVAEEHSEAHQREGRREPHHDDDHDEAEHQEPEGGIAHVLRSPPMPRWRATSSISLARSMAILRDSSSTYSLLRQLLLDHVDLGDVLAAGSAIRRS